MSEGIVLSMRGLENEVKGESNEFMNLLIYGSRAKVVSFRSACLTSLRGLEGILR